VLFVGEQTSVERQLGRGRAILAHNERVRRTAVGQLIELRPTDVDEALARNRYRTFKELTYEALTSLRRHFQYHFVNADAPLHDVEKSINAEFQYQSSLELGHATHDIIHHIPVASEVTLYARQELVRRLDVQGASVDIGGLTPGQYSVTSRAVDSSGIFGPDSPASSLRVVGAELPVGARYEAGAILLGQRSRVKLLGAQGLEASYGASTTFVTAPDTVGLSRGEGTVLRLREPGTVNEVRVGLEPRTLRADVDITPKHPRWPEDMIEVTVHLFDARGRAVNETVQVKPTVMVDVTPVEVKWLRSDNALHAFVPAPQGLGPWVVRVEIADEFGDPAGRDFMEVAGPDSDRISTR
jgi:hypothetical protein